MSSSAQESKVELLSCFESVVGARFNFSAAGFNMVFFCTREWVMLYGLLYTFLLQKRRWLARGGRMETYNPLQIRRHNAPGA